jgi:hypothetical protein
MLKEILNGIKQASNMVLDATMEEGLKKAQEKLDAMNRKSKHNFFLSVSFDVVFIVVAIVCLLVHFKWALPALWIIGATKLIWTLVRLLLLFRDLKPHWKLIKQFVPVFAREFVHSRSLGTSIKITLHDVFKFFYGEKLNTIIQTVHSLASLFGAIPSVTEIEDKVVGNFYPPLNNYIRNLLFVNVVCFIGFYGILMGIVKFYLVSVF